MDSVQIITGLMWVCGAYLLGSINSAIIVSKAFSLPDPRSLGSGNPGATNVLRTGNKLAAAITLIGDVLKGLIPVLAADFFTANTLIVAATGVAALLGHMYPIYYRFQGGKGVATLLGVLLGFDWILAIVWAVLWLIMAAIFRYSSLAALVATALTLVASYISSSNELAKGGESIYIVTALVIMSILVFWRHRGNIKNILGGTESRIGKK